MKQLPILPYKSSLLMGNFIISIIIFLTICIASCSRFNQREELNLAESLMNEHPELSLAILNKIDNSDFASKTEEARYALLMSMALDKNYIDTTTFDVLQPAIDYYLKKGTPDEKLRTYYYQGCIYENKRDYDNALNSFTKAIDNAEGCTDSLCLARALCAQGLLFHQFYDNERYMQNALQAANINNHFSNKNNELSCLFDGLNGAILLKRSNVADSIINLIENFDSITEKQYRHLQRQKLMFMIQFGSKEDAKKLLESIEKNPASDVSSMFTLASAYRKIDNPQKSFEILKHIDNCGDKYDTLKYESIAVFTYRDLGDYKNAFITYWDYSHRWDAINANKFKQKSQMLNEKHEIELQAQRDAEKKSRIILICIAGIVLLALSVFILILLARSHRVKKDLALQKAKTAELENESLKTEKDLADQKAMNTQLENEKLKTERENLALENRNLQLERDKKALEAENLAHRVETLENESESLKKLMETPDEIPAEVQSAIKVRMEMLNSLLAGYITDNEQYEKPYDKWVKELTDNTEEFMNTNRLAFQASHPKFIQYFEDHGLTRDEINYVCLYAIGLRGKEVGSYMKKRSHVNLSSAIRKKLGIDQHETNIGIYVRRLLQTL